MQYHAEFKDGDTDDLGGGRVDERALVSVTVALVRMFLFKTVRVALLLLEGLEAVRTRSLDVVLSIAHLLLNDRLLRRAGRAAHARLVIESGPVREGDAAVVRAEPVPVRVVRDPEARELRRPPAESDDLDDEDEEDADQRNRERVRLRVCARVSNVGGTGSGRARRTYSLQPGARHGDPSSSMAGSRRWIKAVAIYEMSI